MAAFLCLELAPSLEKTIFSQTPLTLTPGTMALILDNTRYSKDWCHNNCRPGELKDKKMFLTRDNNWWHQTTCVHSHLFINHMLGRALPMVTLTMRRYDKPHNFYQNLQDIVYPCVQRCTDSLLHVPVRRHTPDMIEVCATRSCKVILVTSGRHSTTSHGDSWNCLSS